MNKSKRVNQQINVEKNESHRRRWLYYASLLVIISAQIALFYIAYLLFYPYNVLTVKNPTSLPVDRQIVQAGEDIGLVFDYKKPMNLSPIVKKQVICDEVPITLGGNRRIPTGEGVIILKHKIPEQTPSSKSCIIYIFLDYQVNPIRVIHYEFISKPFQVINPIIDGEDI